MVGPESNVEESHGLWQCIEDESDSSASTATEAKVAQPKQVIYQPIHAYNGFFEPTCNVSHEEYVQHLFKRKTGPNDIVCALNSLYMKRQYTTCLELIDQFMIQISKRYDQKRFPNSREILDLATRCAIRLDSPVDKALGQLDTIPTSDPGSIFFKARVYVILGRFADAFTLYSNYLLARKNDYLAWKDLGFLFLKLGLPTNFAIVFEKDGVNGTVSASNFSLLGMACLDSAYDLVIQSSRPDTEYSNMHKQTEIENVESRIAEAVSSSGVVVEMAVGRVLDLLKEALKKETNPFADFFTDAQLNQLIKKLGCSLPVEKDEIEVSVLTM